MVDLSEDLAAALSSPRVRDALTAIMCDALKHELGGHAGRPADARLIDAVEAARLLGMSVAAVRKAATRGTLPCVRLGRRVRFRVDALLMAARPGASSQ